jgi:hypothetical protein
MPLLTELFILFGLNYNDVAPTALNAAFLEIKNALDRDWNAKYSQIMKKDKPQNTASITS